MNPLIPSKKALLKYLCDRIPHTEIRKEFEKRRAEQKVKDEAAAAEAAKEEAKAKALVAQKKAKAKKKK